MAQNITFNGVVYTIPDTGDDSWGLNLSNYFIAIPQGALQKSGGTFTLGADVNFGASFGLLASYFKTRGLLPATIGLVRLNLTDTIAWRNNANSGNLALGINGSDQLTFNGSAIIPGGITALTGDVTATGPGSVASTIGANKVLDSMIRQSAGLSILGRSANSTGNIADITAGSDGLVLTRASSALTFALLTNSNIDPTAAIAYTKLALAASIVNADISGSAAIAYSKLNLATSILNSDISASAAIAYSKLALTGSVVNADISASAAIAYSKLNLTGAILNADLAGSIALTKLASISTASFLGRTTAGTGSVENLTATQATALLNAMVGDSGAGGTKGLVPAPASGDAAAEKYLKANGSWDTPAGAGTVTSVGMTVPSGMSVTGSPVTGAGTLAVTGFPNLAVTSKTTTYTALSTDGLILCSGSAFTVTLPAASTAGKILRIKKTDSSFSNIITIARAGTDTIDGATSTTLNTQYEIITLVADGSSNWSILSRDYPQTWTTYTPTFTNLGTVTSIRMYYRRTGSSIQIRGTFNCGTGSASDAAFTIPSGLNLSTTELPTIAVQLVGSAYVSAASQTNSIAVLANVGGSATNLNMGISSATGAGAFTFMYGNTYGSGTAYGISNCVAPIAGWN